MLKIAMVVVATLVASGALAADAVSGRRIAQDICAACHAIAPQARSEVADAPPFEAIGRKHGFAADTIAQVISGPHPKMNFSPPPHEAADIAAYIVSLEK